MSIRCGFFNSINNDRKYNAEDMGRLFEGVISDGIFSTVEPKFEVEPVPETMNLLVNNGKAWFHERYFEIYDPETVTIRQTDINSRIDAICICINTTDSVRAGSIEVVEGSEAETPTKPSMPVEEGVYYIPIAWITISSNDTVSTDLDIESNVGNSTDEESSYRCPYSEPSLDPRRAVYAYEGESQEEPPILKFKVRSYMFDVLIDHTLASNNVLYTIKNIRLTELGFDESVIVDEDFIKKNKFIINYADREPIACIPNGQTSQGDPILRRSEYIVNPIFWEYNAAIGHANGIHVLLGYKKPSGGSPNDGYFRIEVIVMESTEEN